MTADVTGATSRRARFIPSWHEDTRTRLLVACGIGGALATVVFAWMLLEGRAGLLDGDLFTNFYDAQAHAWLHGRWNVPGNVLFFERFNVEGKFYMYHGPWPALLRLPFAAVTDSLDGRLSRVSMLGAFAVLMAGTTSVVWQTWRLVRGAAPVGRRGLLAAAGFVFVVGVGSPAMFLGSIPWVYHEALLWGMAWSIVAFAYLIRYLGDRSTRALVLASVAATFGYLSRGSVGIGPVAALGLLFLLAVVAGARDRWRRRGAEPPAAAESAPWWERLLGFVRAPTGILGLGVATAVPVFVYGVVNYVKFHTFLGAPPVKLQDLILRQEQRAAALAANNGSLFGIKFAPTNLLQYVRPDGIRFDRLFPWVDFSGPPTFIGDVVYDRVEGGGSLFAASTFLALLAVVGVVAVLRTRPSPDATTVAILRVPVLGAIVGSVGILAIAFIAHRYLADFVPLMVLLGAVGLWAVAGWSATRTRAVHIATAIVLTGLAIWSCWANTALALRHQRSHNAFVTLSTRQRFVDFQLSVYDTVPGGLPSRVEHGDSIPDTVPRAGTLFVQGDCEGVYVSNDYVWTAVEQSPATGRARYRVRFPVVPDGTVQPLAATGGTGAGQTVISVRTVGRDRVRFEYRTTATTPTPSNLTIATDFAGVLDEVSEPIDLPEDRTLDLIIRLDPAGYTSLLQDGDVVLSVPKPVAPGPVSLGAVADHPAEGRFTGSIDRRPTPTPVCDHLRRLEGASDR